MSEKPLNKQPTVRINLAAKEKLDQIQAFTYLSQPALLDRAIDLLVAETRADQLADELAALGADKKTLKRYHEISETLERSSEDGLRK